MADLSLEARIVEAYKTKEVDFKFRGRDFRFALSQGLFSSADIDGGTRFLLKILSKIWDEGLPPPKAVLDAGCGAGVLGICAAALSSGEGRYVRCQDRDALAQAFTLYNALQNGVSGDILSAYAEPLLGGDPHNRWDLILSNIPAKAGKPVLEDFVSRSAGLLTPLGRALVVAVNPLADFFRSRIINAGVPLLQEDAGADHTVFLYGGLPEARRSPIQTGETFFQENPFYHRCSGMFKMEGVSYSLDALQGVRDFDRPGGVVQVAAKLITSLYKRKPFWFPEIRMLIHEPAQGHFPVWFLKYLEQELGEPRVWNNPLALSGRNILALEAARHNIRKAEGIALEIHPLADMSINRGHLGGPHRYDLIAAFPELTPQINRIIPWWEGIESLLAAKGMVIIGFSASEAERFDRKKPKSFTRLSDTKHKGFRALAYQVR